MNFFHRVFKGESITFTGTFQNTQSEMYKLVEKHGAKKGRKQKILI